MYGVVSDSAVRSRDDWVSGLGVWVNDDFFPLCCCLIEEADDLPLADVVEDGLRFAPGFEVVSGSSVVGVTSGSAVGPVIVSGCVTSSEVVSGSAVGSGDWLSC